MHAVQISYSLARVRWSAVKVYLLAGYRMALTPCQGTTPTNQWSMSNKLDGQIRSPNLYRV